MNRTLFFAMLLCLPLFLAATELSLNIDLSTCDPSTQSQPSGWGTLSSPGEPQLPVKTVNVILPPGADDLSYTSQFSSSRSYDAPAPQINPAFSDGDRTLTAPVRYPQSQSVQYLGISRWGDVRYASFRVLPAIWTGTAWQGSAQLQLNLSWSDSSELKTNRIPPVLRELQKGKSSLTSDFFANPADLTKFYSDSAAKNYDYLIVSTPALYAAVSPLEVFHQGQGMITAFADISVILASSTGTTDGEKLRNYLVDQYNTHPFSYLLLVGDYDTVPVLMLTPEPDGSETIPSDFFYGDLSSIIDTDSDGRLGEYSPSAGLQDYLCDFTPEVFVGRISNNSTVNVSQIATRTVAYEQSTGAWKNKALLPAAFLNYQNEDNTGYLQTDGATFMEYAKATALRDMQCTTMYEQEGVIPSFASDYALDYDTLQNLMNTESWGIINWSAHGSATSSSRKVWMNDDNVNQYADSWEMQWMDLVDKPSFNNLTDQNGVIIFAASCDNGEIDAPSACLMEYALTKKAVNTIGATRTGWYKIGWNNPGWGGLSSYNYHFLENLRQNGMSTGAAVAYAGLTHTQYYMFGDPIDSGGIIYPELQNVYTYLLYGDPAVGHTPEQSAPLGEILVYEPVQSGGLAVVNALNANGRFNVVYTDKLIPDYDYINRFEAVFCLFGWGDTAYILQPGSLEYTLLNSYLTNGGNLYLEGDVGWDQSDDFWGKFDVIAPLDVVAYIEAIGYTDDGITINWGYDQTDPDTYVLLANSPSASILFHTSNSLHPDYSIAVYNDNGVHKTIASSFALDSVILGTLDLTDMLTVIMQKFGLLAPPVSNDDPLSPVLAGNAFNYPNPFSAGTSLHLDLNRSSSVALDIFNLRGQKVRSISSVTMDKGAHELLWDGLDSQGLKVSPGIYLWRLQSGNSLQQGKMLKLAN